ncbi:MAG: MFS transporter [Propionibacteriaceae bacterium]|jgi:NNP family nitrate/nitrite transporter-like MFS transporter|nr:MFS transporter [Propionibacteriaceae bacterium]
MSPTSTTGRKHVVTEWTPEDPAKWDQSLAWKTLWTTTYSLMLGFVVWFLVSSLTPMLTNASVVTQSQAYWLAAMPGLAGGALRLLWMFLPPIMGTRNMVIWSTVALMAPMVGWAWLLTVVQPLNAAGEQPLYAGMMLLAFLTGIGGGVFSGYMPSTSFFFPKAKQGVALGLQAGLGNFGVSVVQLVTPIVVGMGLFGGTLAVHNKKTGAVRDVYLQTAPSLVLPLLIISLVVAIAVLKSVPIKANFKQQLDIFGNKHTWLMTLEYVLTFGIFSGLAGQFGNVLTALYGSQPTISWLGGAGIAFLGAFVGSLARVAWGPFCDRFGGGIWTFVAGIGIAIGCIPVLVALRDDVAGQTNMVSMPVFLTGMFLIFFFAGVGNASTFKQMPMIFPPRQAGGVIGWTAAIAAFGPFLFGVAFDSFSRTAVFGFVLVYALLCAGIAWYYYARKNAEAKG